MRGINTRFALIVFCFFLSSRRAKSQPSPDCNNVTQNNSYLSNRNTVLSDLRNHSSLGSYYYNTTAGLSPNTVYGMFFCIGNISRTSCSECVDSVTSYQGKTCDSHRGDSFVFSSQDCMVWYTDAPFFALVVEVPAFYSYSPDSSLNTPHFFNRTFPEKLDKLILRASSSLSSPIPYFVENQETVTQLEGSYHLKAMVQCSPDLVPHNCTVCLRLAVQKFFECCNQPPWARISFPKCVIDYNISALQPSLGNTKGMEGYGRTLFAIMTALVLALMS